MKENFLKNGIITFDVSLIDAMRAIDKGAQQIAIITDSHKKLLGVITDGDIRRALLNGAQLEDCVEKYMNSNPVFLAETDTREKALKLMRERVIHQIPIVNERRELLDIWFLDDLLRIEKQPQTVVLMAGGFGKRLGSMTQNCPKPMLKVGGKPILETIIQGFVDHGYHKFIICVNYLADQITSYFKDGSAWGIDVSYVHENDPLGTAGALSLIEKEKLSDSFFVMNGDLLTRTNYRELMKFHCDQGAHATMCVREYKTEIPFGVVNVASDQIVAIEEKPVHSHFVNAGIYVLTTEALKHIPAQTFYNMTTLFETMMKIGGKTTAFPLREYWIDVGQKTEFEKAENEYKNYFS